MIGKLAFNNIKKSYRIYMIYIFTLTLTIALFYGFNALEYSPAITNLAKENTMYTGVFLTLIKTTSYFVSFFVVFLMIYASDFFFKVRSKEYYIYKTLGMSRKELIKLIFMENLFVGMTSIGIGIVVGVLFNQILSGILINYINLDQSFEILVSVPAMISTAIYFIILLAIISIFSALRINKKTIIALKNFKAEVTKKQMQKYKSTLLIIVGLGVLAVSYYSGYISDLNPSNKTFFLAIICGFIGTIITYFGVINFNNTGFKAKTHNSKTLKKSILYNRLMKNKMSISMISVSFVFILTTIFGANALIGMFEFGDVLPTDAQIASYDPNAYSLKQVDLAEYGLENQGATYESITYIQDNHFITIVKQNDFNQLISTLAGEKNVATKDYQFFKGNDHAKYDEKGNQTGEMENSEQALSSMKIPENQKIEISENENVTKLFDSGVLVVNDQQFSELIKVNPESLNPEAVMEMMLINYDDKNDEEKVMQITKDINLDTVVPTTRQQLLKTSLVFKVSILFVTIFIAFFLVIISLAILAIQQVMDAIDNKLEYEKLRILGLNKKEIKKIIRQNTNIYFMYPLILALLSSSFALLCVDKFVKITSGTHLLNQANNQNTLYILIILVIIYIIYVELVKNIYFKIVGV